MSATVGVVVPAYQAHRWLGATLASLQAQTFRDWVCVVVDDGSTDGTLSLARAHAQGDPRIRVVSQANRGVTGSRNVGLEALPAVRLVSFVDSDDVLLPGALSTLVAAVDARPDAVGAFGLAEYVDEHGVRVDAGQHPARQRARRRYERGRLAGRLVAVSPTEDLVLAELVVANPFWPPATGVVRQGALRAVGGFDERFQVQEDWQLWMRLVRHGPIAALDTVVAEYRRHLTNLTADYRRNYLQQDLVRRDLATSPQSTPDERALAVAAWRRELAGGAAWEVCELVAAVRAGDARRVPAAGVRAAWAGLSIVRPGGPRADERGVRWRPRRPQVDGADGVDVGVGVGVDVAQQGAP